MHINILHKAEKVVLAVQKNAYCDERVMLEWINEVGKPSVTFCRVLLFDSLKVHMVSTVRTQLEDAMTDVEFVLPGATMLAHGRGHDGGLQARVSWAVRPTALRQRPQRTPPEERFMEAGLVPIGPRTRDGRFTAAKPPAAQLEANTIK
ncbi:hypothetical protein PF005_g5285 [Phytophthora fragariae]|uniref:DDE-1 domain-containing protein n=1 Tax=Phytophthora fragariae TaxID=53985 RepID=A0A6A3YW17_9STRA|nr:hypothetical protein PF005_g5285 [Phytophthora fragariae]